MIRALAITENATSPDDPALVERLNNLALLYRAQRDYEKAIPLLERALAINTTQYGAASPGLLGSLNNLAFMHVAQGAPEKAEGLLKQALAITEKSFGPENPRLVSSLTRLADFYRLQGQFEQAEPLLAKALGLINGSSKIWKSGRVSGLVWTGYCKCWMPRAGSCSLKRPFTWADACYSSGPWKRENVSPLRPRNC